MTTIADAGRETVLHVRALAGALAHAASSAPVFLDLRGVTEPPPAAQKAAVTEHLTQTLADQETVIRSKKLPPTRPHLAVRARRLIELHENYDAVERTYTPGVGFRVLVEGLILDEQVKIEAHGLLER